MQASTVMHGRDEIQEDGTIFGTHPLLPSPAAAELLTVTHVAVAGCWEHLMMMDDDNEELNFLFIDYSPHLEILRNRLVCTRYKEVRSKRIRILFRASGWDALIVHVVRYL